MLPEIIQNFLLQYSYFAVFVVLLICGLGVPLPEDVTLISAGIIAGLGKANLYLMFVVCYFGILIGDSFMYLLGKYFGDNLHKHRFFNKLLTKERLRYINFLFSKYGNRLIFIARFLPGLRSPIYVITGLSKKISLTVFLLIDGLAAVLSVPIFIYLGYYGAENREWLLQKIKDFEDVSIVIFAIFLISGFFIYRQRAKHKKRLSEEFSNYQDK